MASMDQATQVQRLRTVMPRLLWSLSTEVSTVGTRQLTAVHSMGTPSRHRYELRHTDERRLCDKVRQVSKHLSDGPLARPAMRRGGTRRSMPVFRPVVSVLVRFV
jgi:nucleotidyltransferase/DNA polymerase involved in DNA repair